MQKKGKMKMTGMGRGYSPQNTGPATSGPQGQGPQNQGPVGAPGMGSMPNPQNPNMMPPAGPGGNAQASGGPMMGPNVPQSQGMPPTGPNMGPGPGGPVGIGTNVSQSPGIGPSGPVMGPQGMRNQDRPGMPMGPQMQHGQPMQRQYGSGPQQGYQGSGPRAPYPNTNMPGTPPQGQGMHSRVHQSMPPPPNPYPGRMPHQGSMGMDSRKRPAPEGRAAGGPPSKGVRTTSRMPIPQQGQAIGPGGVTHPTGPGVGTTTTGPQTTVSNAGSKKKKKMSEKILPQKVRDLVPESQAYMDLLAFERKLDFTIMRKRLDIQEALKRPMKQKRKLRIFISNTFYPGKPEMDGTEEPTVPSWELRVEGRLLDDPSAPKADQSKGKRKFSSFFKSLVIELDKDLYGPDNHLVEWHRTPTTTETDGFQVKRPGDKNVRCTILLLLDYQPLQFKLDPRLARLLGIHTQTRPMIISALWQYIKTHKLQDPHEREYVNCDKYLEQIFQCQRMKFAEVPQRLHQLLHPPDPIVINHTISNYSVEGPDTKKTACYDIDVEVDDALKVQMNNFLLCTSSQQEIQSLDNKIHETVETINQLKTNREFFLSFAKDPQQFIDKWLMSQTRDLKTITDVVGNPEEERKSDFYYQTWAQEAVCRYFYGKVQQRRAELEQALGIRNT